MMQMAEKGVPAAAKGMVEAQSAQNAQPEEE